MSLTATDKGGGDYELTPVGTYTARCYRIVDMGTQNNPKFGESHKVMISWELFDDDVKMQDGRPFSVHNTYTVSLNEKSNLRKHLEAWRGQVFTKEELDGFDLATVLGKYCMIQIVHKEVGENTYANIQAIMKAPKGDKPEPVNEDVVFDIDEPDMDVFEKLSDNMKGKIMTAPEWKGSKQTAPMEPATTADDLISKPKKPDTVIEDIGDEPINLDDIPF